MKQILYRTFIYWLIQAFALVVSLVSIIVLPISTLTNSMYNHYIDKLEPFTNSEYVDNIMDVHEEMGEHLKSFLMRVLHAQ